MDKSTFCILPWIHTYMSPSGEVSACCDQQTKLGSYTGDLQSTMNLSQYKDLRKDLYNGVKNSRCSSCWNREQKQFPSMRTEINDYYKEIVNTEFVNELTDLDDFSLNDNFRLKYLDVRSSNLCNYKCRFCGLSLSSGWYQYLKQDEKNSIIEKLKKYDNFDKKTGVITFDISLLKLEKHIPHIKLVTLAGGEPVMMPGTYMLLEEFIKQNRKDTEWNIISNTSRLSYGKKNIIDLLSFFDKWKWSMSIDAIGDAHTYLRSDADDWNVVYENSKTLIEFLKSNPYSKGTKKGMELSVHSSVSWFSLYRYYDVWQLYHDQGLKNIKTNIVQWPEYMRIDVLPLTDLHKAHKFYMNKWQEHKDHKLGFHLKELADYIKQCIDKPILPLVKKQKWREMIKREVKQNDRQRNRSLFDTFPEWKHLQDYFG